MALYLEPTTVSMQLNKLEEEIGENLFDRSFRPMKLTPLGEYLYPRAQNLVSQWEKLEVETKELARQHMGWLGVGFTRATMLSLLPATIRQFKKEYPNVQLDLLSYQSADQPAELLSGHIQVGVSRFRGDFEKVNGLTYTVVREDPFVVALPKESALGKRKQLQAEDLNGLPRIIHPRISAPYDEQLPALLEEAGVQPGQTYFADDVYMALEMVSSGLGYCLVARPFGDREYHDIVFLPVCDITATVKVVAVTKKEGVTPLAKAFVKCFVESNQGFSEIL